MPELFVAPQGTAIHLQIPRPSFAKSLLARTTDLPLAFQTERSYSPPYYERPLKKTS
jgi:hypothetical protein